MTTMTTMTIPNTTVSSIGDPHLKGRPRYGFAPALPAPGTPEDLLYRFTQSRRAEGLTAATTESYAANLRHYLRWAGGTKVGEPLKVGLDALSVEKVREYVIWCTHQGLRPRTIRSRWDSLNSLCDWCESRELLADNPARRVPRPKLDSPQRAKVSDAEVEALFAGCQRLSSARDRVQGLAVVGVLVFAGLRRAELRNLRVGDIDREDKSITVVHGKGRKTRKVYPFPECIEAVSTWMNMRASQNCDDDLLFRTDKRRGLGENGLRTLLERIRAAADLRDATHITPHALRHNCATRLLKAGYDLDAIRTFLGHSHLHTTELYLHTSEARLKELAPLGGLPGVAGFAGFGGAPARDGDTGKAGGAGDAGGGSDAPAEGYTLTRGRGRPRQRIDLSVRSVRRDLQPKYGAEIEFLEPLEPTLGTTTASVEAGAPPNPAPPYVPFGITAYDELERVAALRDRGIITEEDFTAKKRQLLGL